MENILKALKAGIAICDNLNGEPGRSSNGGHYFQYYRLSEDGILREWASHEDSIPEESSYSLEELEALISRTWDDECCYMDHPRWSLL